MKKLFTVLFAVLLAFSTAACGKSEDAKTPQIEPDQARMRAISELSVMECYYNNVAKFDQKNAEQFLFWSKDKRFWIEYSGTVRIGVDAAEVKLESIGDDKFKVTIPFGRVLSCTVDSGSLTADSYVVDTGSAAVTADDEVYAFQEAQKQLEANATKNTKLLSDAQLQVKKLLNEYIQNVGSTVGKNYSVTWVLLGADESTESTEKASTESAESEASAEK